MTHGDGDRRATRLPPSAAEDECAGASSTMARRLAPTSITVHKMSPDPATLTPDVVRTGAERGGQDTWQECVRAGSASSPAQAGASAASTR